MTKNLFDNESAIYMGSKRSPENCSIGIFGVLIDTENALDEKWLQALEVDTSEDKLLKCSILWDDARETINIVPSAIKFDLIYLDGFSPQKCPQVWTIEFLSKVTEKLNPQGYLITYSSSAAVRKTLRDLGLEIFTIKPKFNDSSFWSQGTVAIPKFDNKKLNPNFNFEKLSLMEEEHLLTKASIPYRDQDLKSSKEDIIKKRLEEQLSSNLESTKKWRDKWGMTKSAFKS